MAKLPTLQKNYEFQRVYGRGKYASSKTLVVYVLSNRTGKCRLGMTTSKKVGNAVIRNRMRRLIRENLRTMYPLLPSNKDIVVVVRKGNLDIGLISIRKELVSILKRLEILDSSFE